MVRLLDETCEVKTIVDTNTDNNKGSKQVVALTIENGNGLDHTLRFDMKPSGVPIGTKLRILVTTEQTTLPK